MRVRRIQILGGLALLVLVGLAGLQWRADRAAAPGTLLRIAPDRIRRITIERPGHPAQRYVRRGGHWWRAGTAPRRADTDGWLRQVAAIAAAPVQRWRPVGQLDLRHLGLDPPRLVLVLDGHRLAYGTLTPFEPGRYVRVGDRVAVIGAQYTPQEPARRVTLPDTH